MYVNKPYNYWISGSKKSPFWTVCKNILSCIDCIYYFCQRTGRQLEQNMYIIKLKDIQWSYTWNPKQPFINGCFNWMIPNHYIGNGCFTKHPFLTGCLGFQVWPYEYWMVKPFILAQGFETSPLHQSGGGAENHFHQCRGAVVSGEVVSWRLYWTHCQKVCILQYNCHILSIYSKKLHWWSIPLRIPWYNGTKLKHDMMQTLTVNVHK